MSYTKRILVTGAGGAAAANFIQSLKENPENEKICIVGTDVNPYHLELSSADKKYLIPPVTDPRYLPTLNRLIEKEKIDYVHPQPDIEVAFLSQHRNRLLTKLFLSKHHVVECCQNKMMLNTLLHKKNIPVPEAYHIQKKTDLTTAIHRLLKKHSILWLRAIKGAGAKASLPIKNISQALHWIEYWREMKDLDYGDFMISEFLPGKEYAFQSVWENGKLLMSQARERCEYLFGYLTVSGQTSTPSVAVTVHNEAVNRMCERAVQALDPRATGIFCIDLKTDARNQIKIMEINIGRFFTTSYFFSKAGINMPYYYIQRALHKPIPKTIKKFNNLEKGLFWIRMIDMGNTLVKKGKWTSIMLS